MVSHSCLDRAKHALVKPCSNPYKFTLRFCKENYFDLNVHLIVFMSADMTNIKSKIPPRRLKSIFFLILQIEYSIQNLLMQIPTMILCISKQRVAIAFLFFELNYFSAYSHKKKLLSIISMSTVKM